MIVDRAALAAAPTEDEGVVRRAGVHEVAPVTLRGKLREFLDGREFQSQAPEAVC